MVCPSRAWVMLAVNVQVLVLTSKISALLRVGMGSMQQLYPPDTSIWVSPASTAAAGLVRPVDMGATVVQNCVVGSESSAEAVPVQHPPGLPPATKTRSPARSPAAW